MTNRKLTILGIVAVCMVILAVVLSGVSGRPKPAPDTPTYLIQGLDTADIGSIVVGTGQETAQLKRQGRGFVLANKDDYPAQTKEINDLITKCLDIQTSQFVTDNPANHKDLEVTEEKARTAVKFFKLDSSLLTGVIIGKNTEQGQSSYIRQANSDKVYIALEVPWLRSRALDYADQNLILAKREDIESVTVISPGGQAYSAEAAAKAGYTLKPKQDGQGAVLENIPPGKKLKDSDSNRVLIALTDLRLTDVKRKSADISPPLSAGEPRPVAGAKEFDRQYVCRLKDSTVYTINIAKKDDKTYITCQADFAGERPTTISKTESEQELKEKEAKLLADDKAKEFTAKHQAWIYEIADWKAKDLTKELSELLEDLKQEKAEEIKPGEKKPEESIEKQQSEQTEKDGRPDSEKAEQ